MLPLTHECHFDGFSSRMSALVSSGTKVAHTKVALNPRIAGGYVVNPARQRMLAAIGEDVFRKVHNPQAGFMEQLKAIMAPGYNQMIHATGLRDAHLNNVRELGTHLQRLYRRDPAGNIINRADPNIQSVIQRIQAQAKTFRGQQNQAFAEIGSMAEPRLQFFRSALPAAAGVAGGGAIAGMAGAMGGERHGRQDMAQDFAHMPLLKRLQYLVSPTSTSQQMFQPPQLPTRNPQPA